MSSPEARGLSEEWIAEHGDPDLDLYIPVDPPHWREQEVAHDRWLAEHPITDVGASKEHRATALSLELTRTQLAFPLPARGIDDEERER